MALAGARRSAWGLLGTAQLPHGFRIRPAYAGFLSIHWGACGPVRGPSCEEPAVLDLVYIGLTLVVFAALWLLVKGVERLER